tara:strand:+ start:608 stop:1102 length:495 start_codon:yes stop_codon:yes gene_type:complete
MHKIKIETYFISILIISFASIIVAYYIEYVLGYQPCNLCLIERIPYGLSVFLIFLNYLFKNNEKFIVLLLILVFGFSFIISLYHFGIETGFLEESKACGLQDNVGLLEKEEILRQLKEKTISCKDVTFRIFGLSLTTLNILLSLILTIILIKIFKNYEKIKHKS